MQKTQKKRHLSFVDLKIVGEDICFVDDPSIKARVVDDKKVEFEGKIWKLSPLTREIQTRRNALNNSGSYSGPDFWTYQGMRLSTLMQKEGD